MNAPTRLRVFAAVVVFTIGAAACSGTTEPTGTTRDLADATERTAPSRAAAPLLDIPSGMTWQQLIDSIADDGELACIDNLLGDELPDDLLDITVTEPVGWPVITSEMLGIEIGDDQWPHELWRCMSPQTTAAVYLSVDFVALASAAELSDTAADCIERLPADADFAAAVAQRLSEEAELSDSHALDRLLAPLEDDLAVRLKSCFDASGDTASAPDGGPPDAAGGCDPSGDTALPPEEIYAAVAPSIPYVETPWGNGSGILIEGDYVLTNHHVVWPFENATVVFPDGTEYIDVPLAATNPWADIALIGPLDTDETPLLLVDGEGLPPGSEMYLIGYPAEYEYSPEPTITSGVLSRVRHWAGYDHTLLQTDSAITGGQSGGALVDGRGCVVGVSTWSWTDANFAVSTSASDNAELIDLMLNGDGYSFSFADRVGEETDFAAEHTVEIAHVWEAPVFVAAALDPDGVTVELRDAPGAGLWVADAADVLADTTDGLPRRVVAPAPYAFVEVVGAAPGSSFTLSSDGVLSPYFDEDGVDLGLDDGNAGVFDYSGDIDRYSIELEAGEAVRIWTDSIGADTYLVLYDDQAQVVAEDDDSGPAAVFGVQHNAEIRFEASAGGTFWLEVGYFPEFSISHEYLLNVEAAG